MKLIEKAGLLIFMVSLAGVNNNNGIFWIAISTAFISSIMFLSNQNHKEEQENV